MTEATSNQSAVTKWYFKKWKTLTFVKWQKVSAIDFKYVKIASIVQKIGYIYIYIYFKDLYD